MKLYADTPKQIVKMLDVCDFSAIPSNQHDRLINQLAAVIQKYEAFIPLRKYNPNDEMVIFNRPGCPDRLIELVNKYHWAAIGAFYKAVAIPFISKWFYANLPVRRNANVS